MDRCLLHLGDSEEVLDPLLWPTLLREARTNVINIRISRRRLAIASSVGVALQIEAPAATKLIEYTDLNSEDEPSIYPNLTLVQKEPM